jgi:nucleotide-binding universal stress UspA family protein
MTRFGSILCAVDFSPLAPRVLRHAVGFAGALGSRLTVITVTAIEPRQAEATVTALLKDLVPRGAPYVGDPAIKVVRVAVGQPADAILELAREGADLIVAGTRSKSGLSRWLLGSTSATIMEDAQCATLLVPPGALEVVSLTPNAATLTPGTVMAAVDLSEKNQRQLAAAGQLAALAGRPLVLMTVTAPGTTDAEATDALRARALELCLPDTTRFVVRHGKVPDEIDHAAVDEHAGLVVMGLRARGQGVAGRIASEVLKAKDSVVLAVPAASAPERRPSAP